MANSTFINLKGFAIGDGCLGTESKGACGVDDTKIRMEFLYEHGQVGQNIDDEEDVRFCLNIYMHIFEGAQ